MSKIDKTSKELTSHPPIPLLYIETVQLSQLKKICEVFSLELKKNKKGYLLQASSYGADFKLSFLDLFFASMLCYANDKRSSFFLLEKNLFREELEQGVLRQIQKETRVDSQIQSWKKTGQRFSFSSFSQAALSQAGFFNQIKTEIAHLNSDQLTQILQDNFSVAFQKAA